MYQDKILKLMLTRKDLGEVDYIGRVASTIFDEGHKAFFDILNNYHTRYGGVPDTAYLEEYLGVGREVLAFSVWKDVQLEEVQAEDVFKAYVDLQVSYCLRNSVTKLLFKSDEVIKTAPTEKLSEEVRKLGVEVSNLLRGVEREHKVELMTYGEEAKLKLIEDFDNREVFLCEYGIEQLDKNLGGVFRDELITVAAYTGGGKSTFLRQLAYNMALNGLNVVFVTLEMKALTNANHFLTLHANNTKLWGFDKPKITYRKIRDKNLSEKERDYYFNEVAGDLFGGEGYGTIRIIQPQVRYTINDLFNDVMFVDRGIFKVNVVIVDYLTLVRPVSKKEPTREDYNAMITDFRRFLLDSGLVGINAAQINRKGYDSACKHKEHLYDLSVLSDYNSLERDATNIFSIFQSQEMEKSREIQIQHLKGRETGICSKFTMLRDGDTGWHYNQVGFEAGDSAKILESLEI